MTEVQQGPTTLAALEPLEMVDLTQPLSGDGALWNGTQAASIELEKLDLEHGVEGGDLCFTRISLVSHSGTHVDAPRHFFPQGSTIDEYGLDRFIRPAVAVDARRDGAVPLTRQQLEAASPTIEPGDAVLIYFGYAEKFYRDDYREHPYLSTDAAEYLVEAGATLVGVDTLTPDLPNVARPDEGFDFPVHSLLLGDDVLIIENLGPKLATLLGRRFLLIAPPIRIVGGDASPIAPVALVERSEPSEAI